ncbi:LEU3 [Candida pseudojiufengensis]|uniref:LEU3 n=1 Tax=Candida pseudojiufengensis TaxID=497109 RepID=UPI00222483C8|nr:LEU3 [Candida pseudojiufengensis]KAI5964337.1 LEU3 [Candida pseudojiufengensis]
MTTTKETNRVNKNSFENLVHIANNISNRLDTQTTNNNNTASNNYGQSSPHQLQPTSYSPNINHDHMAFANQSLPIAQNSNVKREYTPPIPSSSSTPPLQSNQNDSTKTKMKRMACVECRQQKSKCDAYEKQPNPCTRCFKKGLQCDLKSDYKRTYKRARIAQIEKEFLELKKSLNTAQAAELLSKFPSLIEGQNEQILGSSNSHNIHGNSSPDSAQYPTNNNGNNTISIKKEVMEPSINELKIKPPLIKKLTTNTQTDKIDISDELLACEEKTVESITISSNTIKDLFKEYILRYHPILPVVDVTKGPERIYRLCPPLFWVIIFVSLRRFKEDYSKTLLLDLSPIVKGILAEIMISPITRYSPTEDDEPIYNVSSVYSVQAFLLYSYWPPITSSLSADSSYNTVNTGFFQAIRIGLHAPSSYVSGIPTSSSNPQQLNILKEQIKTWIASNVASQFIATAFGFPACVQLDSSIWFYNQQTSGDLKIPENLKSMLEIAQFEDQMAKALNSNPVDPCGLTDAQEKLPLLKLFAKRLENLENSIGEPSINNSSKFRTFELLASRVHLFSYYFIDSIKIPNFELQKGLIKLYNSAISLIKYSKDCQTYDKKFIKYLPGVYLLNLWQAACIIGKLIHSPLKKFIDVTLGKSCYESVVELNAKASILKHDMAFRSSGITRNMWSLFRNLDNNDPNAFSISIRNRMSASVFFDCLNLVREKAGISKLNPTIEPMNVVEEIEGGEDENGPSAIHSDEDDKQHEEDNENAISDPESKDHVLSMNNPVSTNFINSRKQKNKRSLSNTVDAEQKARQIIRTIPLDPEPISAGNASKRSSIFKVVNSSSESSPMTNKSDMTNSPNTIRNQQQGRLQQPPPQPLPPNFVNHARFESGNSSSKSSPLQHQIHHQGQQIDSTEIAQNYIRPETGNFVNDSQVQYTQTFQQNQQQLPNHLSDQQHFDHQQLQQPDPSATQHQTTSSNFSFNESPAGQSGIESLDLDKFDSDMLWRDVDSVMNDFGFHLG